MEHSIPGRRVVGYCLAIMSVATSVIHFAVSGAHFSQYWLFGVFMLVVAWLQLAWAAAIIARPSRPVLLGGALLNACVIAVYVVTRTAGDVVGPAPRAVEAVGFGDGLCTVLEAAVVAGCAWLVAASLDRRVSRETLITASGATGGVTAILLSIALVAGGPEMVMTGPGGPAGGTTTMRMAGLQASTISLVTSTPGGDISMPDPTMQMAPGMKMASSTACAAKPTLAQQKAAIKLVNAAWRDARQYQSLAFARTAGYRPITPTGLLVVHYINVYSYFATMMGGPVLNTAEPQSLVYANTPKGAVLVAAMFITRPGGPTPQPGGCLTQWHVHTNLCLAKGRGVVGLVTALHPSCPPGSQNRITPPMMHVWFVPIPGGPTAIDASDSQLVQAAERVAAPRNGVA